MDSLYSMDGDHVVIDFAGKKRMKLSLVPFDEGGQADPISGMFAKITEKYSANDTQWAEKIPDRLRHDFVYGERAWHFAPV